ncbi:MAG: hypothetical protein NPMRTHETA2_960002 [Nitrosopumilales archaeon]|nr:MAG: hypothetical protein NPMRTHETA2_960002 [Nitrosopumilales archaeon]
MVSQPLLIDQHTGSAIYIETMCDDSFLNHISESYTRLSKRICINTFNEKFEISRHEVL